MSKHQKATNTNNKDPKQKPTYFNSINRNWIEKTTRSRNQRHIPSCPLRSSAAEVPPGNFLHPFSPFSGYSPFLWDNNLDDSLPPTHQESLTNNIDLKKQLITSFPLWTLWEGRGGRKETNRRQIKNQTVYCTRTPWGTNPISNRKEGKEGRFLRKLEPTIEKPSKERENTDGSFNRGTSTAGVRARRDLRPWRTDLEQGNSRA